MHIFSCNILLSYWCKQPSMSTLLCLSEHNTVAQLLRLSHHAVINPLT